MSWRRNPGVIGCCFLLLLSSIHRSAASETNISNTAVTSNIEASITASNDALRAYLQLQEQLHAAQLSIERTRRESEETAARTTEALASQLRAVEQSLSAQRTRESHFVVFALSVFAAVSFLAVVITAYFQWRTVNRLADLSNGRSFNPSSPMAGLGAGGEHLVQVGAIEQSNVRLLGAMERLEKRILELEHAARPSLPDQAPQTNGQEPGAAKEISISPVSEGVSVDFSDATRTERIKELLDRGQSLLNEEKSDEAIACFDQTLVLDPGNTEALVKKGTAFEKLRKLQEALDCYDRAIAADRSMTIAYLYKGGLYNRMERFSEAVECYEQALRTQEKRSAA